MENQTKNNDGDGNISSSIQQGSSSRDNVQFSTNAQLLNERNSLPEENEIQLDKVIKVSSTTSDNKLGLGDELSIEILKEEQFLTNIDNKIIYLRQIPPPNQPHGPPPQGAPPYGQGYYQQQPGQSYYQQNVGGQIVYIAGPPVDVSRGPYTGRVLGPPPRRESIEEALENPIFTSSFDTVKIRNRFVQRVYLILTLQLVVSFGLIFLAIFEPTVRKFIKDNFLWFAIGGMILHLITMIALFCFGNIRRHFPINFILLTLLTLAITTIITALAVNYDVNAVLYAVGTTTLVCLVVSLFAIQTKWDVTGCGMCVCIGGLVFGLFALIVLILSLCGIYMKALHMVLAGIGTLLFCFYLMYDTQQILGGRRVELSPEEYIAGAIHLYIDIMMIFMYIMTLFGVGRQ